MTRTTLRRTKQPRAPKAKPPARRRSAARAADPAPPPIRRPAGPRRADRPGERPADRPPPPAAPLVTDGGPAAPLATDGSAAAPLVADADDAAAAAVAAPPDPPPWDAATVDATDTAPPPSADGICIVGIGASAGGLEALEQFLQSLPRKTRAAFVVVQHLDPARRSSMLIELLGRMTPMTVREADDDMPVEPEHIYVIPPNKDISLLHGTLHLLPVPTNRGRVLPIDFFFRTLAQDQGERSIGVILSGMGTDGTLGLRAIKEVGGATFVQAPESAKFDSMPRSAIAAGLADVVAPAEELPARLVAYRDHAPFAAGIVAQRADSQGALDKICGLLRELSGNDFSLYKRSTIIRRIERRMGLHQIPTLADYLRYVRENRRELEYLFHELLIGVTSFFRDPGEWERLRKEVLPALVSARAASGVIRAWVAGCSTGEEAYSLAILLREATEPIRTSRSITVQIFATDLDSDAVEHARLGLYPENIAADLSPERLRRFFVREERGYRVGKDIRESVVFAPQNLISDPPFTKVDLIACRNVMIYLSSEVQKRLIPLFYYCINPGGVLFLGTAETVGSFGSLFASLDGRTRLYRRLEHGAVALPGDLSFGSVGRALLARGEREEPPVAKASAPNVQSLVDRLLVQRFSPLGILCTPRGDILYISGRAGRYLEPPVGKANLNIFAMARDGLRLELSAAFTSALRQERLVTVRGVKVGTNGGTQHCDLAVQKLAEPKELRGAVIVVITDAAPPAPAKLEERPRKTGRRSARSEALSGELGSARDEMQMLREEMQTSQEELESTNEELQSTNEELQSANEELTTSKEEMQSLNEELQTVNHELQSKVDELSRSNNDMKNLLNSTDIATLFLDAELGVRRFTTATAKIIKLIPSDIGRPITDIASDLDYPELADDARDVLRTLIYREKQAITRNDRAFLVRIMPYRTLENVIDGVVITFTDASAARAIELAAREQASQLGQMADSLPGLMWGARPDGALDFVSRQWVEYTGVPDAEHLQWGWLDQVHGADRERVLEAWRGAVRTGTPFESELRMRGRDGVYRWFRARAAPIRSTQGELVRWYGTSVDIEPIKRAQSRLATLLDAVAEPVLRVDGTLAIAAANRAAAALLGRDGAALQGAALLEALPEARALEAALHAAPAEAELARDGRRHRVRVERDPDGGWLLVLHPEEARA